MRKVLSIIIFLIVLLTICSGCTPNAICNDKIVTTAKVRYFDGAMETLVIKRFDTSSAGLVHLYLEDGAEMYFGVNNVIIVKETEERYASTGE